MVIAHRGASAYAPENTLAAFDLALQMEADHIELDLHLTSDGHIVVIHDDTIDRTTNGSGLIVEHSLLVLQEYDAGSWFGAQFKGERIPTFDEVLVRYRGRSHIHAEIKGSTPALSNQTANLIRMHDMVEQVTITSFHSTRLEEIHACAPELPTGWLVQEVNDSIIEQARAMGVNQLCPRADLVTPELTGRLHAEGFVVRAWHVTSEDLMRRVFQAGVDGMTVNFPDKLIAYLKTQA